MLREEINRKREELGNSIAEKRDYETTYKLSIELDELIAEYYRKERRKKESGIYKYSMDTKKLLEII